jgi:hypothetical protein
MHVNMGGRVSGPACHRPTGDDPSRRHATGLARADGRRVGPVSWHAAVLASVDTGNEGGGAAGEPPSDGRYGPSRRARAVRGGVRYLGIFVAIRQRLAQRAQPVHGAQALRAGGPRVPYGAALPVGRRYAV